MKSNCMSCTLCSEPAGLGEVLVSFLWVPVTEWIQQSFLLATRHFAAKKLGCYFVEVIKRAA